MAGIFNFDIGSIVSGAGSLVNSIGNQIRGKVPVDLMELATLEVKIKELENVIPTLLSDIDKAQTLINIEDAKSKSFWQSGWRPFAGWICVSGMGMIYILFPLTTYFLNIAGIEAAVPEFDSGGLMTLLFGLLGLGTLRTYEKTYGGKK